MLLFHPDGRIRMLQVPPAGRLFVFEFHPLGGFMLLVQPLGSGVLLFHPGGRLADPVN